MDHSSRTSKRAGWAGKDLLLLLAAPVVLHIGLALWTARDSFGQFWTDPRDRLIFLVPAAAYALVAAVCLMRRRWALLLLVLTVLGAAVLLGGELALRALKPPFISNLPRQPGVQYVHRGDWLPGNPPGRCTVSFNQLGLRGPPITAEELRRKDVRIICIGGSTTENYYSDDAESWPWLLMQKIDGTGGKSAYVGNAGTAGTITAHHLVMIEQYRHMDLFNWVVILCGINDMGGLRDNARPDIANAPWNVRAANAADETFFKQAYRNTGVYWRRFELYGVMRNLLIKLGYDNSNARQYMDGRGYWFSDLRTHRQELLKSEGRDDIPANFEADLELYRAKLREIIAACRARGLNLVFMTQPTMYEENIDPALDALCWQRAKGATFTSGALARMMRRINDSLMEICAQEGVDCIDLDRRVPKNTEAFWDDCHFNINGNRIVADVLAEYFREKLGGTN